MAKNPTPIISLTTDFGEQDGYVGIMRGVILTICPDATLIDLTHAIAPQNLPAAAFVLYQSFDYFPPHTVHCVVVDPGVGSQRRAVAIRTGGGIFVGPDNGVFSLVLNSGLNVLEAVTLTNPRYQLKNVSHTFHGRDIFAPAAAHIAAGIPLPELGSPATNLVPLESAASPTADQCQVIHIDRFGNLFLNLTASQVTAPDKIVFTIGDQEVRRLHNTFADVDEGQAVAYVGSTKQHVEIAVRNGNAADRFSLKVGDTIRISNR
ncbi:MAG: SAM-dependent chlorinase/fluorinase [Anaerolineae bacterium]|nr:SAM-dependent chlorinase/fluorinase [Anaerolineae bacterium]